MLGTSLLFLAQQAASVPVLAVGETITGVITDADPNAGSEGGRAGARGGGSVGRFRCWRILRTIRPSVSMAINLRRQRSGCRQVP